MNFIKLAVMSTVISITLIASFVIVSADDDILLYIPAMVAAANSNSQFYGTYQGYFEDHGMNEGYTKTPTLTLEIGSDSTPTESTADAYIYIPTTDSDGHYTWTSPTELDGSYQKLTVDIVDNTLHISKFAYTSSDTLYGSKISTMIFTPSFDSFQYRGTWVYSSDGKDVEHNFATFTKI